MRLTFSRLKHIIIIQFLYLKHFGGFSKSRRHANRLLVLVHLTLFELHHLLYHVVALAAEKAIREHAHTYQQC